MEKNTVIETLDKNIEWTMERINHPEQGWATILQIKNGPAITSMDGADRIIKGLEEHSLQ